MNVKIIDYKESPDNSFVDYKISGLELNQLEFLKNNIEDKVKLNKEEKNLVIRVYYTDEIFPFHTEESKLKLEDFMARDEIEMNVFLSSILEDF